jgi:hypothetical protein
MCEVYLAAMKAFFGALVQLIVARLALMNVGLMVLSEVWLPTGDKTNFTEESLITYSTAKKKVSSLSREPPPEMSGLPTVTDTKAAIISQTKARMCK